MTITCGGKTLCKFRANKAFWSSLNFVQASEGERLCLHNTVERIRNTHANFMGNVMSACLISVVAACRVLYAQLHLPLPCCGCLPRTREPISQPSFVWLPNGNRNTVGISAGLDLGKFRPALGCICFHRLCHVEFVLFASKAQHYSHQPRVVGW